uniref:C-type lectin domain-containing protein n=1 Tax=Acrobeloides nanus TaxID=290746 RepID=A0A914C456_9BILA
MNCHSISIHNEFDNLFVQAFAQQSSPFFIGIYDAYENGTYKWYDGTPVDYSMWADTPPTGSCAMMKADSLFWYPVPCNSTAYWNIDSAVICHFPPN